MPSSSVAFAAALIASAGVWRGVQKTSSSHARAASRNRSTISLTVHPVWSLCPLTNPQAHGTQVRPATQGVRGGPVSGG